VEITPLKRILAALSNLWDQFRDNAPPSVAEPEELEEPEQTTPADMEEPEESAPPEPADIEEPQPADIEEPESPQEPPPDIEELPEPNAAELPEPPEGEAAPGELGESEERSLADFAEEAGIELPELENRVDALLDIQEDAPDPEDSERDDDLARQQAELENVQSIAAEYREPEPQIVVNPDLNGTRDTLTQTQETEDTDTWDTVASENGVEVQVATDVKYDTTTHLITYRTRTLKFDLNGFLVAITAEGEDVEVTESGPCPS